MPRRALPLMVLLVVVGPAWAQPPAPEPVPSAGTSAPEPAPPPDKDKEKEKKKKKDGDGSVLGIPGLQLKGRVFARAAYEDTIEQIGPMPPEYESLDLSVSSARFGVKYEPTDWISGTIEADVANKPLLRDAFIALKSKHVRGRVGQFKMPISSITLESPWNLPTARRGMIHNLLADRLKLIGRRPGLMASVRGGGWLDPEVSVGAFQGAELDAKNELVLLERAAVDGHNLVARLAATPGDAEVALVAERVTTRENGEIRHDWTAGADSTMDFGFEGHALRAWVDILFGNTRYQRTLPGPMLEVYDATFWSGRAIAAWRRGGMNDGDLYIEPFLMAGLFDPDASGADDLFWESFLGVSVGYWRRARLTLQVELARGAGSIPFNLFIGGRTVADHKAVLLQAGAAF